MFTSLLLLSYSGNTQTSGSITLPESDAKRVLVAAKQLAPTQEKLAIAQKTVNDLSRQITRYQTLVASLEGRDTILSELIDTYKREIENLEAQKKVSLAYIEKVEKENNRLNVKLTRKSRFLALLGLIGTSLGVTIGVMVGN